MRKLNFRVLFYSLMAFCFAMIFARHIFSLSVFHIIFVAGVVGTVLYVCIKYKCIKRFVLLLLIFVIGLGYYSLGFYSFASKDYSAKVLLQGRVSSITTYTGYSSIILDDIKINSVDKTFNVQTTTSVSVDFKQGDILVLETNLTKVDLFDQNGFNSYFYKNNIQYKTSLNSGDYIINSGYTKLDENFVNSFNYFVNQHFSEDIAAIISSVIVGDKSTLDSQIKQSFSMSGLGHLLAISGLHIGFIVSIINIILEKAKVNKKVGFVIMFILLFFYCYICGFSPSVSRACLMSIIFMLARLIYYKYDRLNCLSFCAWIILFIKPLYIFDAGFLLSFVSVFCIFTLTDVFNKLFSKIKYKKLSNTLAVIFSVQVGLIPIMSLFYNNFNLFSYLTNFICVPLFEIIFILTFIFIPLCMLFPFLIFTLKFVELLYFVLTTIAGFMASISWANISLIKSKEVFCVGFYSGVFICSKYISIKPKQKLITTTAILMFSVLCSLCC